MKPCCDRPSFSQDVIEEAFGENCMGGGFRAESSVMTIKTICHSCGWTDTQVIKINFLKQAG